MRLNFIQYVRQSKNSKHYQWLKSTTKQCHYFYTSDYQTQPILSSPRQSHTKTHIKTNITIHTEIDEMREKHKKTIGSTFDQGGIINTNQRPFLNSLIQYRHRNSQHESKTILKQPDSI